MPRRVLLVLVILTAVLPGRTAAAGSVPAPRSQTALWGGPLSGALHVTRAFDPPAGDYGAGHRGVDLTGQEGQPVLAAGAGVVLFAGMVAGRPVVSIGHANGLRTTYEPVEPSVAAGQSLARGSPIGTLLAGHAGCPAAACLHWGLRRGEAYLDPRSLLRPLRVRLLPPLAWPSVRSRGPIASWRVRVSSDPATAAARASRN